MMWGVAGENEIRECDAKRMVEALELARRGVGWCSPNPPVGAVVADEGGHVRGRGWHQRAGEAHAEVAAIQDAGGVGAVQGATLYVTLEPCSTHGRTPPCVDLIRAAGIRRVVAGCADPNPTHAGKGMDILRQSGAEVVCGVEELACRELIRGFARRVTTGRPWVVLKAALSIDGKITRPAGESRWITGEVARADAHDLRAEVDAILVGAGTVIADDPLLTVRVPEGHPGRGYCPLRVVLAGERELPRDAALLSDTSGGETVLYKQMEPDAVLDALGERGVNMLLVEGGAGIYHAFLEAGLVDELVVYVAPIVCGAAGRPMLDLPLAGGSLVLRRADVRLVGSDVRLRGLVSEFAASWLAVAG